MHRIQDKERSEIYKEHIVATNEYDNLAVIAR